MSGIFIVAITMILLPMIYIAMIIGVGYGVFYHATENIFVLGGGNFIFRLLFYLTPIVIGAVLIFFMIKPFFTKTKHEEKIYSLDPSNEPLFFNFIEKICQTVGAPTPKKIDINCDVNASASFRRGLLSFLGNDLTLTVGLPLVAGLNMRQFAGVLAHEFGHFAQGTGMRLSFIIRSISFWFARVVVEKDSVDDLLNRGSENVDIRIGIMLLLAKFFVWVTSKILWFLMIIGNIISSFLLRQMEFDADRYEIRLAGSNAFISTVQQLRLIGIAFQSAHDDLSQSWTEQKLADNFPALTISHIEKIPKQFLSEIENYITQEKTGFFDTHPVDNDRIKNALKENNPGIFHIEAPVSVLFNNFEEISKEVTSIYYQGILGEQFNPDKMISTTQILSQQDEIREGEKILVRFFQYNLSVLRPIRLEEEDNIRMMDKGRILETLNSVRSQIEKNLQAIKITSKSFEDAESKRIIVQQAKVLLECGFRIKAKDFNLEDSTQKTIDKAYLDAVTEQENVVKELCQFEDYSQIRLKIALLHFQNPDIATTMPDREEATKEYNRLYPIYDKICQVYPETFKLRENFFLLSILGANIQGNNGNEKLFTKIQEILHDNSNIFKKMTSELSELNYPFEHAAGEISLANFLIEKTPHQDDLNEMYFSTEGILDKFYSLYYRVLGRLTIIAEKFETAIGLPPLPEPVEIDGKEKVSLDVSV